MTTARDDNPLLHRIEVTRDDDGEVTAVRFICDGGDDAPCHHWPDCTCEEWTEEHSEHPDVQQDHCWIGPWFNDVAYHLEDWAEFYDGQEDIHWANDLRSGPISVTFEGDYMTFEYADAGADQ